MTSQEFIVVIDVGNSVIKVGIVDPVSHTLVELHEISECEDSRKIYRTRKILFVLYSNVRPGFSVDLVLPDDQDVRVVDVTGHLSSDVISFNNRLDVGTDRKLACIAADAVLRQPFAAITLGTATTLTLIADNRCDFSVIWPGLMLSTKLISNYTRINIGDYSYSDVSETHLHDGPVNLTDSTKKGIYFSTVLALEGWIKALETELGEYVNVVLTGGYAAVLSKHLRHDHRVAPNLVLDGMIAILPKFGAGPLDKAPI